MGRGAWVNDANAALFTDLYQFTMLQAYWAEGMDAPAVFDLFVRRLPPARNFLLACGLEEVLHYLESVHFTDEAIAHLASLNRFEAGFLDWLREWRFTGSVRAVPEGTPVFANEPIVEVEAPLPQAQLVETFVLNQIGLQTSAASKAARVLAAAAGRPVADFGMRRTQGADAAVKVARAFHIAGVAATSNVLAGQLYGLPVAGTMAHSYVTAHADELEALRAFAHTFPETILLVDTYDTLDGVRKVVRLAEELGADFRVRGVRLDSGDLAALARGTRGILDAAGLRDVQILASGGLDEYKIADLGDAPVDAFGVGTNMGVFEDAPALDIAYKLSAYAGAGRMKLAGEKTTLPGRKQVYRQCADGLACGDTIALADEAAGGEALLRDVMRDGARVAGAAENLDTIRARARAALDTLPAALRGLAPAKPPYAVQLSPGLQAAADDLATRLRP